MAAWRTPLAVVAVMLTASCASSANSAGTGGMRSSGSSATGTAVSFDAFVASHLLRAVSGLRDTRRCARA